MDDRFATVRDPVGTPGKVSYTATAGTGTAARDDIKAGITSVMIWCTSIAYVVTKGAGTATTTTGTPLPANVVAVLPSDGTAPSAVQDSAAGTMYYRYLA